MKRVTALVVSVVVSALLAGCASAARRTGLNSRLIRHAPASTVSVPAPYDVVPAAADSLEAAMGKIRELSMRARPISKQVSGATIESFDPALRASMLALAIAPSAATHRRVAQEYARLRVFDMAHKNYQAALAFNQYDAATYDGLARLWRDAGLPSLGLGDARRAVYYAPNSAEARNTLGTLLQALGQNAGARRAYESALQINPSAGYALNNLGYLAFLAGNTSRAIRFFQEAIATDGALTAARHNLALAYAAAQRMDLARQALIDAGPPAQAEYNLGIINLAAGRRSEAMAAFGRACRIDLAQPHACDRATALSDRSAITGAGTP